MRGVLAQLHGLDPHIRLPTLIRLIQRFQRFLMSFVHDAVTLENKRMDDFEKRS